MNRKRLALMAVLVLGLVLSGCGDGSPSLPQASVDELPLALVGDLFEGEYVLGVLIVACFTLLAPAIVQLRARS